MPTSSLHTLAQHLRVPERTLRRAAAQGLIHGERVSPRRFETPLSEEAYLRKHWPLLHMLRRALRTEPNVRLAVLFGSVATGRAHAQSDIDLLVSTQNQSAGYLADLTARLERALDREVQLVRLADAEDVPLLMAEILKVGRVLVDRDRQWPGLQSKAASWRRLAKQAEPPLLEALEDLDGEDAR